MPLQAILTSVELAILATPAWLLVRVLAVPGIRHVLPRHYALAGFGLAGYATCLVLLAAWPGAPLGGLAALAGGAVIADRWRARPGYGARRGLPPGSLTLFRTGPWLEEEFYRDQARRFGPVFKMSLHLRPTVCVLGQERAQRLMTMHAAQLAPIATGFERLIPKGFLRIMRPADHARYRPILRAALGEEVLRRQEPVVRGLIVAALRRSAAHGDAGIDPVPMLHDLVLEPFLALLYGALPGEPDHAELADLHRTLNLRKPPLRPWSREEHVLQRIEALLRARADSREPAACALDALAATPGALDDPTVLRNLIYIFQSGRGDLAGLLFWLLALLADHPAWLSRAGDEPPGRAPLAERIVHETLRLRRSEYLMRRATDDIRFEGFLIPRGWTVRICIREGHRLPEAFRDPERFDPDRFPLSPESLPHYKPLGIGAHGCIGAPLTRLIGRILIEELARGFILESTADGPPEFRPPHWRPSATLRLRLTPRGVTCESAFPPPPAPPP